MKAGSFHFLINFLKEFLEVYLNQTNDMCQEARSQMFLKQAAFKLIVFPLFFKNSFTQSGILLDYIGSLIIMTVL